MAKYLVLNGIVLLVVIILLKLMKVTINRPILLVAGILFATTASFDSLIIWAGIVDYNTNFLLGMYIGKAPIEDFFYSIVAAVLIPGTWQFLKRKNI